MPRALFLILIIFIYRPDDPYFYLYYGNETRYPSYFALELEEPEVGRVLRFDSLSKVMSAGIRIGFASGPETLLQAIDRHVRYSTFGISFFSWSCGVTQLSHPHRDKYLSLPLLSGNEMLIIHVDFDGESPNLDSHAGYYRQFARVLGV